jgi:hypothetical protein
MQPFFLQDFDRGDGGNFSINSEPPSIFLKIEEVAPAEDHTTGVAQVRQWLQASVRRVVIALRKPTVANGARMRLIQYCPIPGSRDDISRTT